MTPTKFDRESERRITAARERQGTGIMNSATANMWRGSLLRCELSGEKPFAARFLGVRAGTAELQIVETVGKGFDAKERIIGHRELPWPPDGRVTVVRGI